MKRFAQILVNFKCRISPLHNNSASLFPNAQKCNLFVRHILLMRNGYTLIIKHAQLLNYFVHLNVLYATK